MNSEQDLHSLKNISKLLADDLNFIQAAGGNTSVKNETDIFVKGSGKWLIDCLSDEVFCKLSLEKAKNHAQLLQDNNFQGFVKKGSIKPSMETGLHAIMHGKYVLHFHHLRTLALMCFEEDYREKLSSIFCGYDIHFAPFIAPGLNITKYILENKIENIEIVFLENHGVIVSSNSLERIEVILNIFRSELPLKHKRLEITKVNLQTSFFSINKNIFNRLKMLGSELLYPDQAIFLNLEINIFSDLDDLIKSDSDVALTEDLKLYFKSDLPLTTIEMLEAHCILLMHSHDEYIRSISQNEMNEFINLDEEKFRVSIKK